jgi:hypothetical protein
MDDFREGIPEPQPPKPDLSRLPRIIDVRGVLRRYREPRVTYSGLERVEHHEAVEIVVTTDSPFPVRALAPVLHVGDVPIDHWEMEGENVYRFFAYEPDRLTEGAPTTLAWPDDPVSWQRPADARLRIEQPDG